MFEVGAVGTFTAHHHLVGNFGPASEPHEHTYRVEATVSGSRLRLDGTLFDITRLQTALGDLIASLDGNDLNELAVLAQQNPTAEVVARHAWEQLAHALARESLARLHVRVWESAEAFAAYAGDLGR